MNSVLHLRSLSTCFAVFTLSLTTPKRWNASRKLLKFDTRRQGNIPFLSFQDPDSIKDWLLKNRAIDSRGCWLWTKAKVTAGYGNISVDGAVYLTHRVAAHLWHGFDLNSPLEIL